MVSRFPKICMLLALFISPLLWDASAQVVINELMQSNIDCLMDDQNEFPDSWVELFNSSASEVNLSGYSLELDDKNVYYFPSESLPANAYRLVYCDKGNARGWHAPFRLESSKNSTIRLRLNGVVVDELVGLSKQPAPNIAYGRAADADTIWGYMQVPTPGSANQGIALGGCLGEPIFSLPGQVMSQNATLTLALPADAPTGTQIRYTTDGSEPTSASQLYQTPIALKSTTTIRAKLFCSGYVSPQSTTHSYVFHGRSVTLPVISIVTDNRYLYDKKIGIYVDGTYSNSRKNYEYDWRRPIHLEYFTSPNQAAVLSQLCETRVQGGASRGFALRSLALYAHKRFGAKRFDYEFFPDQRPGQTDYTSLLLRNAGNDFDYLYMRDAVIQRSMAEHADLDWQAWSPAIVYFNGVYKGILNIRERSNDDNIVTNYGGLDNIVMIENMWDLKAGSWSEWSEFHDFFTQPGHTWAEYNRMMDCYEYINLMIMNLYYNNQDFPANNLVYWRPREVWGQLQPRWRFLAKDTDFGLGLYGSPANYQTITWLYNPDFDHDRDWGNSLEATSLFRYAMEDATFRREFIDRSAIYIGDFLSYEKVWPLWESMYLQIKDEYTHHRKLFNEWWPNYQSELSTAQRWLQQRPDYYLNQLRSKYALGNLAMLRINTSLDEQTGHRIGLNFNGVDIPSGQWEGKFFSDRTITLTTTPMDGSDVQVDGWQVNIFSSTGPQTLSFTGSSCTFTLPATALQVIVQASIVPTSLSSPASSVWNTDKRIEDGSLIIFREGHRYTLTGIRLD